MGRLFDVIRDLVAEDKYLVGEHAAERLEERRIMEWQAIAGLASASLIVEQLEAKPHPTVRSPSCCRTGRSSRPSGRIFGKAGWPNW